MDLNDVGVQPSPAEDGIEIFDSFEENAIAKARYFFRVTGLPTVADDSGLVVDALGGAPGVHSKRFAPIPAEVTGEERDQENLEHLLRELGDVALAERTARYVCVAALLETEGGEATVFRGVSEGLILGARRGRGGFGYDPVFFDPPSGKTFAELTPDEKNAVSHRGRAFRSLATHLSSLYGV
jgi:XTP/dITP diphosphohydrolase